MYKEVNDKNINGKEIVKSGYNKCTNQYNLVRMKELEPSLELLTKHLNSNCNILDIGCGTGIPIDQFLSDFGNVTGIDISEKQIELAKKNVPGSVYFTADIMEFELQNKFYDAIVSYYTIFHIPKKEHKKLFQKIYNALKPNGFFLCTLTQDEKPSYIKDDFFKTEMYWSNLGLAEYKQLLNKVGFQILHIGNLNKNYSENYQPDSKSRPIVCSRKQQFQDRDLRSRLY
ncbi:class I SAM-dependent methyltransferase [Candidatus Dependentiae bacterium]|nr:class I SAM-dependent methyltransferase [Candidatus Dependentiae bacterium]